MTEVTTEEPPPVTADDDGIRPAGPPDACLYCGQKVGQRHQPTCVIWTRPVELQLTIGLVQQVPHHWTELDILSKYNESGYCADNLIDDLLETVKGVRVDLDDERIRIEGHGGGCFCSVTSVAVVRPGEAPPIEQADRLAQLMSRVDGHLATARRTHQPAPADMVVFYAAAEIRHHRAGHAGDAQDCMECYTALSEERTAQQQDTGQERGTKADARRTRLNDGVRWTADKARNNHGCRIAVVGRTARGTLQRLVTGRGGLLEEFSQGEFESGSQHTGWDATSWTIRLANGSRITILDADRPDAATCRRFEYVWLDGEPRESPELEQVRARAQVVLRTHV